MAATIKQVKSHNEYIKCKEFLYTKYREVDYIEENYLKQYYDKSFINNGHINMYYTDDDNSDISSTLSYIIKNDGKIFDINININSFVHIGLLASNNLSDTLDIMAIAYHSRFYYDLPVVIGVNPRHSDFYLRVFNFSYIKSSDYNNLPCDVLCLNKQTYTKRMQRYIDSPFDYDLFKNGFKL